MRTFCRIPAYAVMCLFWAMPAFAARDFSIQDRVHQFELKNGLTVLLMPRHTSPTISFAMSFRTGAVDEKSGTTGAAHLLEHMLFKGTESIGSKDPKAEKELHVRIDAIALQLDRQRRLGPAGNAHEIKLLAGELRELQEQESRLIIRNEFDAIYTRNGAEGMNAGTGYDTTTYTVSLPANRLELWMQLESDRFSHPVFREFYAERDVVIEELRQSYETKPGRLLSTQLLATAFQAHPYGRPIIGWKSDIQFLPRSVCEQFFADRYSLANAVVAVVGDIDIETTRKLLEKYFAPIPARRIDPPFVTQEPAQQGRRRVEVRFNAEPQVMIGFHKPNPPSRDDTAFDLVQGLLSGGRTSRLFKSLVLTKKIAASVHVANGYPGGRFPNLFFISAVPLQGISCSRVEQAIYDEIKRLAHEPIPPAELQKTKKRFRADFLRSLDSNQGLSHTLAYFQVVCNDWRYMEKNLAAIETVTASEIKQVIKKYLVPENRTVATLVKE